MPLTAYSYIRFSTPDQARGDSLRRQLEASERYARENGLTLDSSLRDIGVSGYKGVNAKTGALAKFLQLVEKGKIESGSVLIVESLDRLSREDVPKALPRFLSLISAGITVVTLGSSPQRYDSKSIEANPFMLIGSLVEMIRANEESKRKSERVGAAWARKKAEAGTSGPITKRCPAWLKVEGGKFVQIPERVQVVQKIFNESLAGKGKRKIACELNKAGIAPFGKGKGWQYSYIDKILCNKAVLGEYLPHKLEKGKRVAEDVAPTPNYFPAIISPEIFYAARRAGEKRLGKGGAPSGHIAIFSGLIECAHCGSSVVRITKNREKGWVYFVCYAASMSAGCNYVSWPEKKFEPHFLRWIVDFDFSAKGENHQLKNAEVLVASLEGKKGELERKINNLVSNLEIAGGSPALARRLKGLEDESVKVAAELEEQKTIYLDLRENQDTISAEQGEFREIAKDPSSRERLKNELRKRVERIYMVFDANKPAGGAEDVYADGRRFARVKLVNGESWDLFEDGEFVHYKDGRRWVSVGNESA